MKLRPARPDDAYALWLWANDPETRAASGDRPVIGWEEHCRWLAGRLGSGAAALLIAETGESRPVGTIRFESPDGWSTAVLSYLVAPEARGRGFGRALLVEGVKAVRARYPEVRIEATVWEANDRSCRLFTALGWAVRPGDAGRVVFTDSVGAAV